MSAEEEKQVDLHKAPTPDSSEDHPPIYTSALDADYEGKPTEEELATLRRVAGRVPTVAYLLCAVEFCERASYYGCQSLFSNFVNRPLPIGGNGWGAPPRGSQKTGGALGLGQAKANAVVQAFNFLCYLLPLFSGYLADTRTGRYKMINWGVYVMGVGHAILLVSGAKNLLANGNAVGPFMVGIYTISIGAAMFKPCVSPLLLDQMTSHVPIVVTLKTGERVIEDPEHSTERVMLWFYLLINVGGFTGVATSYAEKYVGWWLSWSIPLILYLPLPGLMWYLKNRLTLKPAGGSDLPNVFVVLSHCFRKGRIAHLGRAGFWEPAKPSVQAAAGEVPTTRYNDEFVEDVKRTFQATGIFCFFPLQYWNDNGIGSAANFLSSMLTTNGAPNDVIGNFNSLSIILFAPILNYGLYPALRKARIHYGPVLRITTGFMLAVLSGIGYTVLQYKAYESSPCGYYGASDPVCVDGGLVSPISVWWMAIPYAVGGISELFVNVPAYGIAYSRAPVNMRGTLSSVNLLNTAFVFLINLVLSSVIGDPHLIWDFGGPTIVGFVMAIVFYFLFRHIDKEEYRLTREIPTAQIHDSTGTTNFIQESEHNHSINRPAPIADNEEFGISQKQ